MDELEFISVSVSDHHPEIVQRIKIGFMMIAKEN